MARVDVTGYAAARTALTHPDLSRAGAIGDPPEPLALHVLNLEGADHRRVRTAVAAAVERRTPDVLPLVAPTAGRLLTGLDGEVDLAGAFVRPHVLLVLDALLGLADDERELGGWHDCALALEAMPDLVPHPEIERRVRDLVARRRGSGRGDVVSLLADGSELAAGELVATVFFLLSAGYVNTVNVLGLSLLALAREPDQYAWLREHPDAVSTASEELLRIAEPRGRASLRIATRDLDLGGVPVAAGATVWVHRGRADHDPARFPDPDRLDLRRGAGSLAFGAGAHYCLGASLVRTILDLTLLAVVERVAELRPTRRTPPNWDFPDELPLMVVPTSY